jgi:hypothetical protein
LEILPTENLANSGVNLKFHDLKSSEILTTSTIDLIDGSGVVDIVLDFTSSIEVSY